MASMRSVSVELTDVSSKLTSAVSKGTAKTLDTAVTAARREAKETMSKNDLSGIVYQR